jgi:3-methyladenine DNA glycosylase AlkD
MTTAKEILHILKGLGDETIAIHSRRFFKTGKEESGEGDLFLGIRVPVLRQQARRYKNLALAEVEQLLTSPFHEARLLALLMLVEKYAKGDTARRNHIYNHYLAHTRYINNWDLVDTSAPAIVGRHLLESDPAPLHRLADAVSLWERRIAIIATLTFIRHHRFDPTLAIADRLLTDVEDLIHKAVGWMLREVGKRDPELERSFLGPRYRKMPRTMLRYAIEKFETAERKAYLQGSV